MNLFGKIITPLLLYRLFFKKKRDNKYLNYLFSMKLFNYSIIALQLLISAGPSNNGPNLALYFGRLPI